MHCWLLGLSRWQEFAHICCSQSFPSLFTLCPNKHAPLTFFTRNEKEKRMWQKAIFALPNSWKPCGEDIHLGWERFWTKSLNWTGLVLQSGCVILGIMFVVPKLQCRVLEWFYHVSGLCWLPGNSTSPHVAIAVKGFFSAFLRSIGCWP